MFPILAFDLGDLRGVIPLVIFGIWIVNHIFGNKSEKPEPPRRSRPPRAPGQPRPEQREIDDFLAEVLGKKSGASPSAPAAEPVVLRPVNEQRSRVQPFKPANAPIARPLAARPAAKAPSRAAAKPKPARSTIRPESLGSHMVTALNRYMDSAVEHATPTAPTIAATVQVRRQSLDVAIITQMLHSPSSMRQAIMLTEILGPPVSRRRRRGVN